MSLSAYSEYKPSDAAWLGDIPKHWSLESLRGQFEELKDKNVGALDQNYLSLVAGRGVMPYAEKGEMGNKKPDDLEKCKLVKAGNFVINSMNFGIGAFGVSAHDGVCSPVYVVLEPSEPRSLRYLRWIFDNPGFREVAQSFGNGILAHRAAIGWDDLKLMKIGVPPIEEQEAIATFLDRETAKIDALVAEQERLIALLKEKRQAVISHAVTKGLDPDAAMKDSGIEWLGEVPVHWTQMTVGRACEKISYGFTNPMPTADEGPFMLTANDIGDRRIRFETARKTETEAFSELLTDKSRPKKGDVLLTKDGTLGRVAVFEGGEACINQSVASLRPAQGVSSAFLAHALADGVYQARMIYEAGGTTIKHIYISRLAKMPFVMPPPDEIESLVSYCDERQRIASELESVAEATIDLLKERRAALISATVTGKIDVRELVEQHEMEAA